MNILIVSQYFPPEMGAPQARLFELGRRLVDMGHKVSVITAFPNYPSGKVFPNYRGRLVAHEEISGISVTRTLIFPSNSPRAAPRLLCYLSFAISSLFLGLYHLRRQDVVLVESPPLFLVPTGILIGKILRARIVMNVSDIWPDIMIRMGYLKSGLQAKVLEYLETVCYTLSDYVSVTNPGAADQLRARFPRLKVTVISNGVDTNLFTSSLRSSATRKAYGVSDSDFCVGYCGLHGLAQGLEAVVRAAHLLNEHIGIKFVLVGDGPVKEKLQRLAKELNLHNVTFFDQRPKGEMPTLVASCDICLIPLSARLPGTMPSKVYEAIASGTPVIVAKGCEAEGLVTSFALGSCYEPMSEVQLAAAILRMANDPPAMLKMRENCKKLAPRFDRNLIAVRTEMVLKAMSERLDLPDVPW